MRLVRLLGRLVPVVCMVVNWTPGQMALVDPPMTAGVFTSFLVWQLRPTRDCGKRPSPSLAGVAGTRLELFAVYHSLSLSVLGSRFSVLVLVLVLVPISTFHFPLSTFHFPLSFSFRSRFVRSRSCSRYLQTPAPSSAPSSGPSSPTSTGPTPSPSISAEPSWSPSSNPL
jgi:hypothetical protein